jgi:peptide-methionine (S)-S-oxide reductase
MNHSQLESRDQDSSAPKAFDCLQSAGIRWTVTVPDRIMWQTYRNTKEPRPLSLCTMNGPADPQRATFAAGCFFDTEAAFRRIEGVIETVVGYTGGSLSRPTYEQVGTGTTGHVEAVGIVYDPGVITYDQLLEIFWTLHDPTRADGQGGYSGTQYRPVIFYHDGDQRKAALASFDRLVVSERYGDGQIVTEILPASQFWPADECHQRFYEKCARGFCTSRQCDD